MRDLKLYVIIRNDLNSMSAGKACAQVAHAASMLARDWGTTGFYKEWEGGRGFGTTIVLRARPEEMHRLLSEDFHDEAYGEVVDPTYPVRDGSYTHEISVLTCIYVFGYADIIFPKLMHLELY